MKSSCLAVLVAATATALFSGVHAAECTTAQVSTADAIISTNKVLFQSCLTDLKSASGAAATSFISASYVNADAAESICASENCVKSLIAAMEKFPDCCSAVGSSGVAAVTNLPRLADDILHQCDLIDEKLLAVELEKEIEKLPDLKVNIKGTSNSTATGSGSGAVNATVGDAPVDVIIDVKKRELMKDGKAVGNNTAEIEPQSSGVNGGALVRTSKAVLALAVVVVMSVLV